MRSGDRSWGLFAVLRSLVVAGCVLFTVLVVVSYAMGWMTIEHLNEQDRTTIEIDTGEVRHAAGEAVDKGRELFRSADEAFRDANESIDETIDEANERERARELRNRDKSAEPTWPVERTQPPPEDAEII